MGKTLNVIHFNDVYNIEASSREPVGGAARFIYKLRSVSYALCNTGDSPPLVLFSGDAFNPSLMSTITFGKQMVPVLNAAGVKAAVVGNHDWDWGIDNFRELAAECNFPWLMANVLDIHTGEPLAGAGRTLMLQHNGVSVGLVGLVEGDWVETLATVEPDEVDYLDFVKEGRRLALELKAAGAEVVLALTHMRAPNDLLLLQQVPEIDAVLGGHDHNSQASINALVEVVAPHDNLLCKSGTDFKELTLVTITMPDASSGSSTSTGSDTPAVAHPTRAVEDAEAWKAGRLAPAQQHQQQRRPHSDLHHGPCTTRPTFSWQQFSITEDIPEDLDMAQVVSEYAAIMGSRMDEVIGETYTDLDGRFTTVRHQESNLCNLLCDIFRRACSADVAILNSGTFRSDTVHPAGPLTYRDLMAILPMLDEGTVLEYPKLEGRFPQVSGVRFTFDASRPPFKRIDAASVTVGSERSPLDLNRKYALATKQYMAEGKDGYDVLVGSRVLMDPERCPDMQTALRSFFTMLDVLNRMHDALDASAKVRVFAKRWAQATKHKGRDHGTDLIVTGNCIRHPQSNKYLVAPAVDGRITIVNAVSSEES
eukprot:gene12277-12413_t